MGCDGHSRECLVNLLGAGRQGEGSLSNLCCSAMTQAPAGILGALLGTLSTGQCSETSPPQVCTFGDIQTKAMTCTVAMPQGPYIQEKTFRVIDQPVERAHTGLSPRLGHIVDSMRGTNIGSNMDCRPPEDRHSYSQIPR